MLYYASICSEEKFMGALVSVFAELTLEGAYYIAVATPQVKCSVQNTSET